ncbi:MAG: hypothetical protein WBA07_35035 [Rivularia sp. (in: cyanobacteria)]
MAWSSFVKKATHKFLAEATGDEVFADVMGHLLGASVAAFTLDTSYPVIQTAKWVTKGLMEATGSTVDEKSMELDETMMECQWEQSEKM